MAVLRDHRLISRSADKLEESLRQAGSAWPERAGWRKLVAAGSWILWQVVTVWRHPLSDGRRIRATAALLRCIVQRHTMKREIVIELPGGAVIACPPEFDCNRVAAVGLPDFEEQAFVLDVLQPGDVAIDVGAYIGSFALLMASRGAQVNAFEPTPRTRVALERNIALNAFADQITVHPHALSDVAGAALFTTSHGSGNRLVGEERPGGDAVEVEVSTLDDWAESHDLDGLLLLKVDAEGADERVLKGAIGLRRRFDPAIIVEFWEWGGGILSWLRSEGYEIYRYQPSDRRIVEFVHVQSEMGNVIACTPRRAEMLNARLGSASSAPLAPPRVSWRPDRNAMSAVLPNS